jgi:hypothetical protein
MPVNASFPANFRQTPGDDTPSPFRQGDNYRPYEMPGNFVRILGIIENITDFSPSLYSHV